MKNSKKLIPPVIAAVAVASLLVVGIIIIVLMNSSKDSSKQDSLSTTQAEELNKDETGDVEVSDTAAPGDSENVSEGLGGAGSDSETSGENSSEKSQLPEEEARKSIERLLDEIDNFNYLILLDYGTGNSLSNKGDKVDIPINPRNVTRAAGTSSIAEQKGDIIRLEDDEYGAVCLDAESLDVAARDIFGKPADADSLGNAWNHIYDVTIYDGKPVIMWTEYETDLESFTVDKNIEVSDGQYRATADIYHGYWGYASYNKSNFRFTYEFAVNPRSEIGMVIKSITVERTNDDSTIGDSADFDYIDNDYVDGGYTYDGVYPDETNKAGFYGIWCYALKDRNDAVSKAEGLTSLGLDGRVYLSSEWAGLNSNPYYVVTAGIYAHEGAAEGMLKVVKAAGYSDAYIKFSGAYTGN